MKKLSIALLLFFVLMGCTPQVSHETISITHKLGTSEVVTNPGKVVVFDMGILDIMDALDLKVGAIPKSNLPDALSAYSGDDTVDVGTLFEPNYETLSEYAPDLIIISGRASKQYEELSKIAPTIYLGTDTSDDGLLASIHANVDVLKEIYPNLDATEKMNTLDSAVTKLHDLATASSEKTLFLLANGDEVTTFGKGSRYDHVFTDFGFIPVIEDVESSTHGVAVSFEQIYQLNPDIILVMDRSSVTGGTGNAAELLDNDFVNQTNAAINQKIIYVNPQAWYLTEGGYNSVLSMTEELLPLYE